MNGLNKEEIFQQQTQYLSEYGKTWTQKTKHKLERCIDYLFEYLSDVSKEPFTVSFSIKGKKYNKTFTPPISIKVSDKLFQSYSCIDYGCSKCCWYVGYYNIFTYNQFSDSVLKYKDEKYDKYVEFASVFVNSSPKQLMIQDHTNSICSHMREQKCMIHEENPIHCAFPLMRVYRVKGTTMITRVPFGRNSRYMKCPVKFEECTQESVDFSIYLLKRLEKFGNEMGIRTRVPEIIEQIENRWLEIKCKTKPLDFKQNI